MIEIKLEIFIYYSQGHHHFNFFLPPLCMATKPDLIFVTDLELRQAVQCIK